MSGKRRSPTASFNGQVYLASSRNTMRYNGPNSGVMARTGGIAGGKHLQWPDSYSGDCRWGTPAMAAECIG